MGDGLALSLRVLFVSFRLVFCPVVSRRRLRSRLCNHFLLIEQVEFLGGGGEGSAERK